jgi:cytochrome P450
MITYPPGPPRTAAFGVITNTNGQRLTFLKEAFARYGELSSFKILGRRAYFMINPEAVRQILVEQAANFYKGALIKRNAGPLIGEGLLISEDEMHKRQRKLIQPAFHHQRIAAYAEIMVAYSQRHLANWQDGQRLDIAEELGLLTRDIVSKTLFNAEISADAAKLGDAIADAVRYSGSFHPVPKWIPTRFNRKRKATLAYIRTVIAALIHQRRGQANTDAGDLLSMLLTATDEQGRMSETQLQHEVITLFIAGHETTANALAWTIYLLAQNPAEEGQLLAEIDQVLGKRPATMHDLPNLPYLTMVLKEAMRLYPPAWIVTRLAVADCVINGQPVAAGESVFMSPYVMHRNPAHFAEPEQFKPDRFSPENEAKIPKYVYLPFGAGPRVCIGNSFALMEAQVVLATLLQHYTFSLAADANVQPEPVVTLRPKNGIAMLLHKRS